MKTEMRIEISDFSQIKFQIRNYSEREMKLEMFSSELPNVIQGAMNWNP